jgi:hypothetical protein
MHRRSPDKPYKFKQWLSVRKLMATTFLGQERSADGVIHATRDHNNARSVLRNTNQWDPSDQKSWGTDMRCENSCPHTAVRTRSLLEHFNWALFDHLPYSPDLPRNDYHLLTYLKNWLGSQRFNNNEELMEGVKTWLSSQAADFFDTGIQKLLLRYKCLNSGGDYIEEYEKESVNR